MGRRSDSAISDTVVTWAFVTAGAILGIYQAVGHLDLKQILKKDVN